MVSKKVKREEVETCVQICLDSLKLIGCWPIESKWPLLNRLHIYWGYFIYAYFTIFVITEHIEMYYVWGKLEDVTTNATVSLLYSVAFIKIYILMINRKTFIKMVKTVLNTEQMIVDEGDPVALQILYAYRRRSIAITKFFWLLALTTIGVVFIIPHFEVFLYGPKYIMLPNGTASDLEEKPLVFSNWFPFNDKKHMTPYYEISFTLQIIAGCIGASFCGISDPFFYVMIIFPIGQLQVLQHKFRTIGERCTKKNVNGRAKYDDDQVHLQISQCIAHHKHIIKYVEDLDSWINPVLFLDFCVCAILLCVVGFQLTLQGMNARLIFLIEYQSAMLIQSYLFYWYANELMLESVAVCDGIWESEWIDFNLSAKKLLLFNIHRSQKPLKLNIGIFATMSLQTYLGILKASYTYLALLRQMYMED